MIWSVSKKLRAVVEENTDGSEIRITMTCIGSHTWADAVDGRISCRRCGKQPSSPTDALAKAHPSYSKPNSAVTPTEKAGEPHRFCDHPDICLSVRSSSGEQR